jgi:hypothetical protein
MGLRHRTILAVTGGLLAVVPTFVASDTAAGWVNLASAVHTGDAVLQGGYNPLAPSIEQIAVDGSLPQAPVPLPLPAYELPSGPLDIPATALAAYRHAADIMGREQPGCHIDWALIASIGRIESNHARGGYVDAKGNTLEPILGPVLDGSGPFAAIPDTDQGRLDGDKTWDRAVGPAQFVPSTWWGYASDGNRDGEANPNNVFDSMLATARYLCSGGLHLADPDQLRTAIYRYNNSDTYVNEVILWAEAYRRNVLAVPDSKVPVGAPNASVSPGPVAVPPPPAPVTTPTSTGPATSQAPGSTQNPSSSSPGTSSPATSTSLPPCKPASSTTTTTTTPTSSTSPTSPPTCIPPSSTTTTTSSSVSGSSAVTTP